MGRRTATAMIGVLAVPALVGAACGGSGSSRSTTTTSAQDVAADKAAAAAAILRLTDFPGGWQEAAHGESTSAPDVNAELADCVGVSRTILAISDNPTNVDSPDFGELAGDATVQSSIGYVATVAEARRAMAVFAREELPGCLATAMKRTLDFSLAHPPTGETIPAGLSFGELAVSRLSFTNVADDTLALRVTVPMVVSAGTVNQYLDMVVLRIGRAAATLSLSRTGSPFDATLAEHLAGTVADRLRGPGPAPTTHPT